MFQDLIKSFFLIFIAEMGDKTQILAMAFATQFKASKVMMGVFLGVLLNHAMAIALGMYLSKLISVNTIQLVAGISFIVFSLWTLKIEEDDQEENSSKNYGPVVTVAIAFFLGELGDKTQLTAITLSIDSSFPVFVLMGTVLGMILTSGIGIFIGSKLGKRVPELAIKIVASLVFLGFGVHKLLNSVDKSYLNYTNIVVFTIGLLIVYYIFFNRIIKKSKEKLSRFKKTSQRLYYLKHSIEEVCLGKDVCKTCQGKHCSVGYAKQILKNSMEDLDHDLGEFKDLRIKTNKCYDRDKIINSLGAAILYIKDLTKEEEEKTIVHEVRKRLEEMLFDESIDYPGNVENYIKLLEDKDYNVALKIREIITNK